MKRLWMGLAFLLCAFAPLSAKDALPLEGPIYFEKDSANLTETAKQFLDKLAPMLKSAPHLKDQRFKLVGYADVHESDALGEDVSLTRTYAVRDYLVKNHGIAEDRFVPVGKGKTKEFGPSPTEFGKSRNRRVMIGFYRPGEEGTANIGRFVKVYGEVRVQRQSGDFAAKDGMRLEVRDVVVSRQEGKARIMFADGTIINVGKNSAFVIEEFLSTQDAKTADTTPTAAFQFQQGAFKVITGEIGKIAPEKFALKTRTSTIGVRGTELFILVGGEPVAQTDTGEAQIDIVKSPVPKQDRIACTQGEIVVASVEKPQVKVPVKAGEITQVAPEKAPEPPRLFKPVELKEFIEAIGIDGEDADIVYEYDKYGNVRKKIFSNGIVEEYTYDAGGNVLTTKRTHQKKE